MNEEPESIWKRSWIGRGLFALACLITLIALFYAEEDWRGKHAWEKFKREWEAKGEKFNFTDFVPSPVPDDQNFALTPIVFTCYGQMLTHDGQAIPSDKRDTNFVNRLKMDIVYNYEESPKDGNWMIAKISDLKAWRNYYRALATTTNKFPVAPQPQSPAADVLLALSKYEPAIEELRQASQLPYSRFPLDYDIEDPAEILLPHLATLKQCSLALQLRAIAELQNGQSEKALNDVQLALQLTDKIHTEPFLISHLVRIAMVNITLQSIWEGLALHEWSDAQLAELEPKLARLDFLADYEFTMRGERALGIANIDYLRRTGEFSLLNYFDEGGSRGQRAQKIIIFRLMPSAWFYQNELAIARMYQWILPPVDVERQIVSPEVVRRNQNAETNELSHLAFYDVLARMLFPDLSPAVKKFTCAQESVDLARVAIALERYRLAHGEFPESLDALAPQFIATLPHDIIGGQPSQGSGSASQPLHYRHTSDGQFVLYSVGWNETDDNGEVGLKKDGEVDRETGDWVWRYPAR